MTRQQMNASYRKKLFTDPTFRRLTVLVERENAKRAKEAAVHRDLMRLLRESDPMTPVLGEARSDFSNQILAALADGQAHSLEQLEQRLGCDRDDLRARLKTLSQGGRVQNVSYANWQLRRQTTYRRGESNEAVLSVLNGHPVGAAEVSRCTGLSRANAHRVLNRLGSLKQAVRTDGGWLKAKG